MLELRRYRAGGEEKGNSAGSPGEAVTRTPENIKQELLTCLLIWEYSSDRNLVEAVTRTRKDEQKYPTPLLIKGTLG